MLLQFMPFKQNSKHIVSAIPFCVAVTCTLCVLISFKWINSLQGAWATTNVAGIRDTYRLAEQAASTTTSKLVAGMNVSNQDYQTENNDTLLDSIVLIVKTGYETCDSRVPVQLDTFLKHFPNVVFISDSIQRVGSYKTIHAAGWNLTSYPRYEPNAIRNESEHNFLTFRDIGIKPETKSTDGNPPSIKQDPGWIRDKSKNFPGFRYAWEKYPGKSWYIMIDDDTYLHAGNLVEYLSKLDHKQDHYIGCGMGFGGCNAKSEYPFAHGGSGIVLSGSTMNKLYDVLPACQKEFNKCWAGDIMVGMCLHEHLNISLTKGDCNMFQSENIYGDPFSNPCAKPMTHHHLTPREMRIIYEAEEQAKKREKGRMGTRFSSDLPLVANADIVDLFLVHPNGAEIRGLRDTRFLAPGMDKNVTEVNTPDLCRQQCINRIDCITWSWSKQKPHTCHIGQRGTWRVEFQKPFISGLIPGRWVCPESNNSTLTGGGGRSQ